MNYRKMSEADARLIEQWRYPGEYAIYDEPRFSEIPACQREHFISFFEQDQLIGFVNLLEEETAVFFGIGVHPQACSRGVGTAITREAIAIAKQRWPHKPLYLEVRTWNQRAVACYERAGFVITKKVQLTTQLGPGLFYHMETNLSDESIRDAAAKSSK